jgi:hypothetical protein
MMIQNFKGKHQKINVLGMELYYSTPPNFWFCFTETYINSIGSQYIGYRFDEWKRIYTKAFLHRLFAIPICLFQLFFFIIYERKVVFINNQLWSTNLYSEKFTHLLSLLKAHENFKGKAQIYRNINVVSNPAIYQELTERKAIKIANRKVMLFDYRDSSLQKKRPLQTDLKKWEAIQNEYQWIKLKSNQIDRIETCLKFYNQLYLEKYSQYNPAYTVQFLQKAISRNEIIIEYLIANKHEEKVLACLGYVENHVEITNPFIGYDESFTEIPLYRMINIRMIMLAKEKNKLYNMSSGASDFKMQRGGKAVIEYHFIVPPNSVLELLKWKLLAIVSNKIIEPILLKH